MTYFLILVLNAMAGEVIDLGKLEVKGTDRGPDIHIVDSNRPHESLISKLLQWELEKLENELLDKKKENNHSNGN